ncbi:MAG: pentapeptide repeat-containing protein, partial [Endozoicomonas sp.]
NLRWANLSEADLSGANLSGANLSEADLSGAKGILTVGPVGQNGRIIQATVNKTGLVMVRAGCFYDSIDKFSAALKEKYGDSDPVYSAVIPLVETWAKTQVAKEVPA